MTLDRREMLRMGAVGAGGLMLSSAASSVGLPALVFRTPPPIPDPLAPMPVSVPRAVTAPTGINPQLFARAKAALNSRPWVRHRDVIGIADFSVESAEPRFHLVNHPWKNAAYFHRLADMHLLHHWDQAMNFTIVHPLMDRLFGR